MKKIILFFFNKKKKSDDLVSISYLLKSGINFKNIHYFFILSSRKALFSVSENIIDYLLFIYYCKNFYTCTIFRKICSSFNIVISNNFFLLLNIFIINYEKILLKIMLFLKYKL